MLKKLNKFVWFFTLFGGDRWRYIKYCSISPVCDKQKALYYKIIIETHSLEKGLSVAHTRPGFGKSKINYLIDALSKYDVAFGAFPVEKTLGTLQAYYDFHTQINFEDKILDKVSQTLKKHEKKVSLNGGLREFEAPLKLGSQKVGSDLLKSRFSSRVYSEEKLTEQEVENLVRIAQQAPSQCNRQATKAYFFNDINKIRELLSLQAGAGGFNQDVSNLFLITSELSAWGGAQQRNQPYVDGALFSMALLYSCHANDIVSCPLNLAITHKTSDQIKKVANVNKDEVLIMMIAVGKPPKDILTLKVAKSARRPVSEILVFNGAKNE
ncbi:nitroreductase family protein [Hirschia litorea]|uniref:Nitroreductase family protein n=1 Tax=Hirschia litorea TaxID=1199156 RepID=A0ABW2IPV6_9PROT